MPADLVDLKDRSLLRIGDFTPGEITHVLDLADRLKREKRERTERRRLEGCNIALIFEKSSTRTRCAFEVAAADQGARATNIDSSGSHLGAKESMRDTARVLGRLYDGIEYRGHGQRAVEELARHSGVPVWNGLSDEYHPTQALADLMTMREHHGGDLASVKLAFLGDAANNTATSLMMAAAKTGLDARFAAPRACWPNGADRAEAEAAASGAGGRITVGESVADAVAGCDFVYTDVWVSLGEPAEVWAERIEWLRPYQVNRSVMDATGNPKARFLHCLPAFHDLETAVGRSIHERFGLDAMEVTDEIFDSEASIVFDQAENRMHTIKALMVATLTGE
jgi:ornithine carbamoyltransferase